MMTLNNDWRKANAHTLSSTMSVRRGTALRQGSRRNTADNMAHFMQQASETPEDNLRRELSAAQKENDRVSLHIYQASKASLTFLRCINTTNASFSAVA